MDAINLFVQFTKVGDLRSNDIMSQHHAYIFRQNSPIFNPHLSSKGIKTLKDVIDGKVITGNGNICLTNINLDLLTFCLGMSY